MGKAHREKLREIRRGAGERRVSEACKHCFQYWHHSGIPAPGIPCDWSILTVYANHVNRSLTIHRRDHNENVKKQRTKTLLISKTTTSHVHHILWLCGFCTTMMWKGLISCFVENVNKQRPNFISLSKLGQGRLEFNFRRNNRDIFNKRLKERKFSFLATFPSRGLIVKSLIAWLHTRRNKEKT